MRQQNVQQHQGAEEAIRRTVTYWRQHALPKALVDCAAARDVDCGKSIVLKLEIDFPGMPRLFGLLLTSGRRFIVFEIDSDENHLFAEKVDVWRDVTVEQNLSLHNAGTGAGFGALALKVLNEIEAVLQ